MHHAALVVVLGTALLCGLDIGGTFPLVCRWVLLIQANEACSALLQARLVPSWVDVLSRAHLLPVMTAYVAIESCEAVACLLNPECGWGLKLFAACNAFAVHYHVTGVLPYAARVVGTRLGLLGGGAPW